MALPVHKRSNKDKVDRENGAASESAQLARHWHPRLSRLQRLLVVFYWFQLVKSFLLVLQRAHFLESFRWLDCFLPGRPLIGSRIPQASKYIAFNCWLFLIAHALFLKHLGAHFNHFCLEFFFFQHLRLDSSNWWPAWFWRPRANSPSCSLKVTQHPVLWSSYKSTLDQHRAPDRPMRTRRKRQLYARLHLIALGVLAYALLTSTLMNVTMFTPLLTTKRGFELIRENCVRFILTKSANSSQYEVIYAPVSGRNLSSIYDGRHVPLMLPYTDLVPFNSYQITRILIDAFETLFVWFSISFCYWYYFYFVLFFSLDTHIYAHHLHRKLDRLTQKLRLAEADHLKLGADWWGRRTQLLGSFGWAEIGGHAQASASLKPHEITRIQAALLDYFMLISFYNDFMGVTVLINVIVWLLYTFLIFVRILRVDRLETFAQLDRGVQFEFFAMFLFCLSSVLFLFGSCATLNSRALGLYRRITSIMVLDRAGPTHKRRWLTLLKYFRPRKLCSFTILEQAEISWLLCLKLFSWVISALVILKSL